MAALKAAGLEEGSSRRLLRRPVRRQGTKPPQKIKKKKAESKRRRRQKIRKNAEESVLRQLFAQGLLQGVGFVRGGCCHPKSTLQMLWGCERRCEPHHQNPSTFGLNMSGFGLKEQPRLCASSSGAGAGAVDSVFLGHFCTIPESSQGCRV